MSSHGDGDDIPVEVSVGGSDVHGDGELVMMNMMMMNMMMIVIML